MGAFGPISGTAADGVWGGSSNWLTNPGTYSLQVDLGDRAQNWRRYSTAELGNLGLPTQVTVSPP